MPKGRVIAVVGQKGGIGKTTTTVSLASALAGSGSRVLVVDVDPQGSLTYWTEVAAANEELPFDFTASDDPALLRQLRKAEEYDFVLVDTPGSLQDEKILEAVLESTDYCVLPCEASALSLRALMTTIARLIRPRDLTYRVMLNKIDPRTTQADAAEVTAMLDEYEIPYFDTPVRLYKAHTRAPLEGVVLGGYAADRSSKKAAADFQAVTMQLMSDWLRKKPKKHKN